MRNIKEFISGYDDDTLIQMIQDYEILENTGIIGDLTLRRTATAFLKENDMNPNIVWVMEKIAAEVFRIFSTRYFAEKAGRHGHG